MTEEEWYDGIWKTTVAIAKYNEEYSLRKYREDLLKKIDYGHDFGYNRVCKCGVSQRDFHANESKLICRGETVLHRSS